MARGVGRKTDLERFTEKVEVRGECWIWTGGRSVKGYGVFWFGGKLERATKVSKILMHEESQPGKWLLHTCDNPPCVNPDHLFFGSAKDNTQDMMQKGRQVAVTKLTDQQVSEISAISRKVPQRVLAAQYGVHQSTISMIRNGKARIDVTGAALKTGLETIHLTAEQMEIIKNWKGSLRGLSARVGLYRERLRRILKEQAA